MNILRKLGASLCAALLSVGLFGIAWSNVGIATIRDRSTVKGWLDESGFYTKIADVALEKIKNGNNEKTGDQQQPKSENSTLPIDDPQVQAVAKIAFSPEFLKTNVEKFLDGSYDWLDGTSDKLAFNVDLTPAKQQLATGLGNYATTKAAALPVCATNESAGSFDAFSSVCRPKALSAAAAGQALTAKLLTSDEFLAKPVLTANDIKIKDDSGEVTLDNTDNADIARKIYRLSGFAPLLFGVLALLSALGIVFISRDRLKGIKRVGWVMLVAGIILSITYLGLGQVSSMSADKLSQHTEAGMVTQNKLIIDIAKVILSSIQKVLVVYAVGYVVLGLLAIIAGGMLKKRRDGGDKKPADKKPKESEDEAEKDKKPEETEKPKPEAKESKKVQL